MSSTCTRYDEDIAASLLDESALFDDIDERKVAHLPETNEIFAKKGKSDSSEHFDETSETESIDELDESYQSSGNEVNDDDDDASWSDYEVEYDYESEFYNDNILTDNKGEILLSNQVNEVSRKYGEESIFFCGPPEALQLHFGPTLLGVVYLCFPTVGGPLESKLNLSSVWGFDPTQPIIVRLCGMMHLFSENATMPLTAADLGIAVYQGNEPSDFCAFQEIHSDSSGEEDSKAESKHSEEKNSCEEEDSSIEKDGKDDEASNESNIEVKDEKPKEDSDSLNEKDDEASEDPSPPIAFRLGTQIQKIAEEFLLSNLRGNGRKETSLSFPLESTAATADTKKSCCLDDHECPRCTDTENKDGATIFTILKDRLPTLKTPQAANENGEHIIQNRCRRCTFINIGKAKKCEICEEDLVDFQKPDPDELSKKERDKILQTYVEKAELGGKGVLARLYAYLNARMPQLHRFCVNCDSLHLDYFGGLNEPIRPSVCRRDLCSWQFMELGVGSASTDELASAAEVVDLLLAITTAAATSPRASKILNPFPLLVQRNGKRVLDPDKPDYNKAREIISQLPSMQQIVATNNERDLEKICAERGEHVQSVFRWITSSCTAHLVSLSGEHRLNSMGTSFQFLMHSASPEQERAFAAKKTTHGSIFGFHGSPIENWHAILREGVKNCSGTNLQLHGAAHGSGVYISQRASVSLGYSKVTNGGILSNTASSGSSRSENKFISGEQVGILALCEVIDDNTVKKTNNSIWVVPNEKNIITRFLFVFLPFSSNFSDVYNKAIKCDTADPSFQSEIQAAMDNIKNNY